MKRRNRDSIGHVRLLSPDKNPGLLMDFYKPPKPSGRKRKQKAKRNRPKK